MSSRCCCCRYCCCRCPANTTRSAADSRPSRQQGLGGLRSVLRIRNYDGSGYSGCVHTGASNRRISSTGACREQACVVNVLGPSTARDVVSCDEAGIDHVVQRSQLGGALRQSVGHGLAQREGEVWRRGIRAPRNHRMLTTTNATAEHTRECPCVSPIVLPVIWTSTGACRCACPPTRAQLTAHAAVP